MSAEFQVAFNEAGDKLSTLIGYSDNFKSKLEDLYGSSQAILDMWDGPASESFKTAFNDDYQQMQECYEAVVEYCNSLGEILDRYKNAETTNAKMFD